MIKIITAPEKIEVVGKSVFLAGSIEQGKAVDWQKSVVDEISKILGVDDATILNPRRSDWDWTWPQTIDSPKFKEQVDWELDAQDKSDFIAMNFDPNTKSPISLLELGLQARSKKLIVCCPEGFWRKGNVDIVCHRYKIRQVNTTDELIKTILDSLFGTRFEHEQYDGFNL